MVQTSVEWTFWASITWWVDNDIAFRQTKVVPLLCCAAAHCAKVRSRHVYHEKQYSFIHLVTIYGLFCMITTTGVLYNWFFSNMISITYIMQKHIQSKYKTHSAFHKQKQKKNSYGMHKTRSKGTVQCVGVKVWYQCVTMVWQRNRVVLCFPYVQCTINQSHHTIPHALHLPHEQWQRCPPMWTLVRVKSKSTTSWGQTGGESLGGRGGDERVRQRKVGRREEE